MDNAIVCKTRQRGGTGKSHATNEKIYSLSSANLGCKIF